MTSASLGAASDRVWMKDRARGRHALLADRRGTMPATEAYIGGGDSDVGGGGSGGLVVVVVSG
jgi:hypothetical protein